VPPPADSPKKLRVLLAAQHPGDVFLLREMVNEEPHSRFTIAAEARSLAAAVSRMTASEADVVLLDLDLTDSQGIDTFTTARNAAPELPIVVLSDVDDEELGLQTVQLGAHEYLVKGRIVPHLLHRALRYAVERARADAQLTHERNLLHTLLDNVPDRIYFKDRRSRFIRVNRALTDFFGLASPGAAIGRTDGDFFESAAAQQMMADERRIMETGTPILGKIESRTLTSGEKSWTLTTKLPLRDRQGRIIGTCGISREVTAIKTMEEQLATERHLLRALIDNLPDLIFLKDAAGRYLLDNAAHLRFLGASEFSEINGRTPFDFYPDAIAAGIHEEDMAVIRTGQPLTNHEQEITDVKGRNLWVLTTKIPWLDESGKAVGVVCISRDISQQKLAEAHLKQANADLKARRSDLMAAVRDLQEAHEDLRSVQLQLVEAEKMKSIGRLAAGVAHEVKNPLAILSMGLEYLTAHTPADETTTVILKEMTEALHRADGVIRGLLDFSAPKRLHVHRASLNVVINQALRLIRGELKGAQIHRDLQEDLPLLALDTDKISQVFVNLFTNALHATQGTGTLRVRTFSRQLTGIGSNIADPRSESFRVGENIVVAEIDDTGPGVPEEQLGKIFEPFFTTKPTGQGSGLGLSVVKTIIDLHRATIDLRNLPDGGARVTIMFQV